MSYPKIPPAPESADAADAADNANAASAPEQQPAEQPASPEQASPGQLEGSPKPVEDGERVPQPPPTVPGAHKQGKDLRASPRYMVNWKIALIFDEGGEKLTYQGRTYDLSMNGTAMLAHHNVFSKAPVTVLLAPPPLQKGDSKKVIEIQAQQVYSVYSGALQCFRLGLNFVKFKGDGQNILRDMLAHYRPSAHKGDKLLK